MGGEEGEMNVAILGRRQRAGEIPIKRGGHPVHKPKTAQPDGGPSAVHKAQVSHSQNHNKLLPLNTSNKWSG